MPGKPVATLGSMHVCPLVNGTVPHVGGPVSGPGAPNVLVNGKPVAIMGDMCVCTGPPDTIVQGNPSVLINGTPVATMGAMTAHGGSITVGEPNVMISTSQPKQTTTMPLKDIPFPKVRAIDSVGAKLSGQGKKHQEALDNQEQIRKEAEEEEGDPVILRIEWLSDELIIKESRMLKKVKVRAHTMNADDGETINFKIKRVYKANPDDEEEVEEDVIELSGTVSDNKADAEFEIEDYEAKEE
ncbi:MAG: PAAR domain-containing protein [Bacteroidales bacterium]|nr:PAAR domain-containing protein [Bacteroidales bacterium]